MKLPKIKAKEIINAPVISKETEEDRSERVNTEINKILQREGFALRVTHQIIYVPLANLKEPKKKE